ncbi:MAG: hypothetical protein KDI92_01375 [Xanthomonadales bacterium]|nr:hypothetical protein [Xanthomonadales bacterium]
MKKIILITIFTFLSTLVFAEGDEYIHCLSVNPNEKITYFSEVFFGDYGRKTKFENRFYDYLKGRVGANVERSRTSCFFEDEKNEAESEQNDMAKNKRRNGYSIEFTNWSY